MLTGRGANLFAESIGVSTVSADSLVTEYERKEWELRKKYMTGVREDFNLKWYVSAAFDLVLSRLILSPFVNVEHLFNMNNIMGKHLERDTL